MRSGDRWVLMAGLALVLSACLSAPSLVQKGEAAVLGRDHPDVASSLNNLADLNERQGPGALASVNCASQQSSGAGTA